MSSERKTGRTRSGALSIGEIALFILFSTIYYSSSFPIAASNEGAHYAQTSALVTTGELIVDDYFKFHAGNDCAFRDGHFYADRPIGTALIAAPFNLGGRFFARNLAPGYEQEMMVRRATVLAPALIGALGVVLFTRMLRAVGLSPYTTTLVTLMFALAGQHWKFSSHLFSHVFTETLVIALWCLVLGACGKFGSLIRVRAFAVLLGSLPLFAYESMMLVPFFALAWIGLDEIGAPAEGAKDRRRKRFFELLSAAPWFLMPILILLTYHTIAWGNPFYTFGRFQNPFHFVNSSFTHFFGTPFWFGLHLRLFQFPGMQPDCPYGLFVFYPVTLIGLFAVPAFYRSCRTAGVYMGWMVLAYVVFFAKYGEFCGGTSGDPRYLLPIVPLLFVPTGFLIERVIPAIAQPWLRAFAHTIVATAAYFGALVCLVHFSRFHGHDFDYRRDIHHYSLVSYETVEAILSRVFVSRNHLGYLAVALGALGIALFVSRLLQSMCRSTSSR